MKKLPLLAVLLIPLSSCEPDKYYSTVKITLTTGEVIYRKLVNYRSPQGNLYLSDGCLKDGMGINPPLTIICGVREFSISDFEKINK